MNLVKAYEARIGTYEAGMGNMASYLTSTIMLEAENSAKKKKKNARGRKNWLKGEHAHQNLEPTTLLESDHTNSHSYPRLLKF